MINTALYHIQKGKIIMGENSNKSCFGNRNIKTHAEIDALKKMESLIRCKKIKNNKKMDLIVIRVRKNGDLAESAPCKHCTIQLTLNKMISINNLYYSRNDGSITCIKFNEWSKNNPKHVSKGHRVLYLHQCNTCN